MAHHCALPLIEADLSTKWDLHKQIRSGELHWQFWKNGVEIDDAPANV
jgi:hypothetical protein